MAGWKGNPFRGFGKPYRGRDGYGKPVQSNTFNKGKVGYRAPYTKPTVVQRGNRPRSDGQVQDSLDQSKFPYRKRHQGPYTKPEQVPVAHSTLFLKGKCPSPCCQDLPHLNEKQIMEKQRSIFHVFSAGVPAVDEWAVPVLDSAREEAILGVPCRTYPRANLIEASAFHRSEALSWCNKPSTVCGEFKLNHTPLRIDSREITTRGTF